MKKILRQCQAVTINSTYSDPHRCLKVSGIRKVGAYYYCAHHRPRATKPR